MHWPRSLNCCRPYPVATKIKGNWELSPTVAKVIAAQAKAARKNGCAFIDRFQELGGREALKAWRGKRPRLLSGDNVHLTREGSKRMGEFVFALLTGEYDRLQGRAPVN